MTCQQLTPADISAKIDDLDHVLVDLEAEASRIALAATEGDAQAAARLSQINGEIEAMKGDREILQRARRAAESRALAQRQDEGERQRAAHRAAAKDHAEKLLTAAQRLDAVIADFAAISVEMAEQEDAVRRNVRLSGGDLGAIVGRSDAAGHGHFLIGTILSGSIRRRNDRTVSELVSMAWSEYLEPAEDSADA